MKDFNPDIFMFLLDIAVFWFWLKAFIFRVLLLYNTVFSFLVCY